MKQNNLIVKKKEFKRVIGMIEDELIRAEIKFPGWPDDIIHGVAVMAEESGEAVRAALQLYYQGGSPEEYRTELAQTAAMCIRAIIDLDRSPRRIRRDEDE